MKKSILKYFKAFTLIGVMASFIALSSCGSDDGEPAATETIWEIVEGTENLSSLEAELISAELDATLAAEGNLTLFAPTNAALATLLGTLGLEDFSTVNSDIAKAVLAYHVAGQIINSSDLTTGAEFTTLQGETFEVGGGPSIISGATSDATFQITDIKATNGVVHIIEVVMVPPSIGAEIVATLGTLAQPIFLGADFTILAEGIRKADATKTDATATIAAALIGGTDLTVFAPTNATFEAASITAATLTAEQWDAYVRNHVVAGQGGGTDDGVNTLGPDDMTTGSTYTTLIQGTLFFVQSDPVNGLGIFIDSNGDFDSSAGTGLNAEVVVTDAVTTDNGRIHVIAGILAPAQ